jgi:ketosteroid isomerase-like protein
MNESLTLDEARVLVDRLLSAISSGDEAAVREVYAPDGVIRNNYSPDVVPLDQFVVMLGHMHSVIEQLWFEPIRLQLTASGFVDEHVGHFRTLGGASIALVSCMVVEVRDGRIVSVADYANAADMAPLNAEVMAKLGG